MALPSRFLSCLLLVTIAAAQTSITLVTSTTTITATESGACNNFVGACVVYGTGNVAPYSTTVYANDDTTISTSTTTLSVTATTAVASACNDYEGACVVYGTGVDGASYTTTVYGGSAGEQPTTTEAQPGNDDGFIGQPGSSDGYIGEASTLSMGIILPMIFLALLNVGFFVFM